jgi:hypothetical protein
MNATSMKVSEVSKTTSKPDYVSQRKTKRVEICNKFSEPKFVEAKSAELCEGGGSDSLCHTPLSSSTSSQATAVVEKVETPPHGLVLSVLADQGVGEFVVQPLPEVHVPAGHQSQTCGTVRAGSVDQSCNPSVLLPVKESRGVKTDGMILGVNFSAWLINMVLFDYLSCMLILIAVFIRSLKENLITIPLLQRLRLQRGCKLFSALGSPPPVTVLDPTRCEFKGGNVVCMNESITETSCCASRRCREHDDKKFVCGCWLTQAIHASKRRLGAPEASVINVIACKCDMASKPPHPRCLDCQAGILCFRHMGICKKTAFTACDLCTKLKCYEKRCLDKIC